MFEESKDDVRSSVEDGSEPRFHPQFAASIEPEKAPRTTFTSNRSYMKGLRLWITILALALGTLLVAIDNTVIAVAIPKISSVFDSLSQVGWYGSAYLLTVTATQPTCGRLYKYFNMKYTFLCSVLVFEGEESCSPSFDFVKSKNSRLRALRSSPELSHVHSRPSRGRPWGCWNTPGRLGYNRRHRPSRKETSVYQRGVECVWTCHLFRSGVGRCFHHLCKLEMVLLHVRLLLLLITTRLIATSNLPIGFASFFLILLFLDLNGVTMEDRNLPIRVKLRRLDLVGAAILICALCCLLLALQWGGTSVPWRSSRIIGLLIGSGLILICFFLLQWRLSDDGTMPLPVLFQRSVAFGSGFELFLNISNYTVQSLRNCHTTSINC